MPGITKPSGGVVTILTRHGLLLRVGVIVLLVIGGKLVVHYLGLESISVNPLFSGIIAADVFLMGFLLSGVLSDYKESERLPGELAASLESLAEEVRGIELARPEALAGPCLGRLARLAGDILNWFYKRHGTADLITDLNGLTSDFAAMERQGAQATLVGRLKQEQGNIRRALVRIHTIRETSFIASGYWLADAITVLLCLGLVLAKIEPFFESLFFAGVISYLVIYLLLLIRDLDNPFGYYDKSSGEDVSLKPLQDTVKRLEGMAG